MAAVDPELLRENRKVCLLLPFYKSVHPLTVLSLMSMIDRTRMRIILDYGDAFIAHSRNKLAAAFLKSDMEWGLMCDDDSVAPFGNAKTFNDLTGLNLPEEFAGLNAIDRLLSHGKTLVGGLYFGRWRHGLPVYAEGRAEEVLARKSPQNILKPTRWVGTGLLLIHRRVFQDIEKKFPHLAGNWFTSSEHDLKQSVEEALAVLDDTSASAEARAIKASKLMRDAGAKAQRHSSLGVGEDVQFCHRAAQAGHTAYVDMGLVVGHVGNFCFGPKKVDFVK